MTAPLDVLVVGGGPAGLATAIRLKQQLAATSREASVAVVDKAPRPGNHALSGAAFEADCLDELVPGWRDDRRFMEHVVSVERDEMYSCWRDGRSGSPSSSCRSGCTTPGT